MSIEDELRAMEAPDELIAWARERPHDAAFSDAWDACPRADWQAWLAGAAALPLADLVLVMASWAGEVIADVPQAKSIAIRVLELAEATVGRTATRADCLAAAEEAEQAAIEAPTTFRDTPPVGYSGVVRGAAWVARAAEGLMTANLRAEAARMQRAQRAASYLGAGAQILLEPPTPVMLDVGRLPEDAFHAELLYVVASSAEAASHLSSMLAAVMAHEGERSPTPDDEERASALGAARMRELFRED